MLFCPLFVVIWIWGKSASGSLGDLGIPADLAHLGVFRLTIGFLLEGRFLGEAFNLIHLWFLYYPLLPYALALALRSLAGRLDHAGRLMALFDRGLARILRMRCRILVSIAITLPLTTVMGAGVDTPNRSLVPQAWVRLLYGVFFSLGWLLYRQPGPSIGAGRLALAPELPPGSTKRAPDRSHVPCRF